MRRDISIHIGRREANAFNDPTGHGDLSELRITCELSKIKILERDGAGIVSFIQSFDNVHIHVQRHIAQSRIERSVGNEIIRIAINVSGKTDLAQFGQDRWKFQFWKKGLKGRGTYG